MTGAIPLAVRHPTRLGHQNNAGCNAIAWWVYERKLHCPDHPSQTPPKSLCDSETGRFLRPADWLADAPAKKKNQISTAQTVLGVHRGTGATDETTLDPTFAAALDNAAYGNSATG